MNISDHVRDLEREMLSALTSFFEPPAPLTATGEEVIEAIRAMKAKLGPPVPSINVVESMHMSTREWVRRPRSKKRRIRKKWMADARNWRDVPMECAYLIQPQSLDWMGRPRTGSAAMLVMHPTMATKYKEMSR